MASLFEEVIEEVGPPKVFGITTDHAKNMLMALRLIEEKYPWMITSGCKLHLLHLAVGDILKMPDIKKLMKLCREIAIFFMYVFILCDFILFLGERRRVRCC